MENNNFKPFPFDQLKQKKEPEKTAVAIAYEPGEKAPKILATGKGQVAEKIIEKAKYGAIGFHPSLLPRHRGQDAVRWTTAMNDSITGATVFWLDDSVDGGDIFLQKTLFVDRKWNYHDLWREIFPIGVEMICKAVDLIEEGNIIKIPQDEKYATWEPSFTNTRLKRNELLQIGNGINI